MTSKIRNVMGLDYLKPLSYKLKAKLEKALQFEKECINASNPSYILLGDSFISRLEWRHKKLSDTYFKD